MKILFKFFKALYVSFIGITIFTLFVLPSKLWLSSIDFLSNQYDEKCFIKRFSASEMKVLSWITLFFNCLIFLSYILGIVLIISLFFKGFSSEEIKGKLFFVLFASYFSPIILSFLKELVSLRLLTYFKLESIETNAIVKKNR